MIRKPMQQISGVMGKLLFLLTLWCLVTQVRGDEKRANDPTGASASSLSKAQFVEIHKYAWGSSNLTPREIPNQPSFSGSYRWGASWLDNSESEAFAEVAAVTPSYLEPLLESVIFPATPPQEQTELSAGASKLDLETSLITSTSRVNTPITQDVVSSDLSSTRVWIEAPASESAQKFHFLKTKDTSTQIYSINANITEFVSAEPVEFVIPANQTLSGFVDLNHVPMMAAGCKVTSYERLVPVGIAVDADRNGEISFDGKDKTSSEKPFRFWINNDQDDVEYDEPVVVEAIDAYDLQIKTKRDLEDFCRLSVKTGLGLEQLQNGDFKIGLRFRNTSTPAPAIRIWPNQSVDGNLDYLTYAGADAQIVQTSFGETFDTVIIPKSYWLSKNDSTAQMLFEGIQGGMGELVVVLLDRDGVELGDTCSTWIRMMDVREMYQRARIVNEAEQIPDPWVNPNPPAQSWNWDPNGKCYVEDPDAEAVTAVFVHGWRMPYNSYVNWADTSYKRLWQQGFKGKFYSFRWPTYSADNTVFRNSTFDDWQEMNAPVPPGGFTYNPSEYRAWLCGPALASFVNQLPNPGRRNLFAHSMGNVISGAALRAEMKLTNYALCNAAVSAMAYDPSPALIPTPTALLPTDLNAVATPDNDEYLSIRQTYGLAEKFKVPSNGVFRMPVVSSFGLPNDAALGQWSSNNEVFRPQSGGLSAGSYDYVPLGPSTGRLAFVFDDNGETVIRDVTTLAEAFAYITKSKTRAAGADLRTRGVITSVENMGAPEFGFGSTHSAVWRWNNQLTTIFWQRLTEKLELKSAGP